MSNWYKNISNDNVVVSTRIRLARNLSGIPFPARMTDNQRDDLKLKVKEAIKSSNTPFANSLNYIDMRDVPENEVMAMVERHIISPEFAESKKSRAIILSDDESISIMIGEEDHIRIQVILGGLELDKAYNIAEELDMILYQRLNFAFSEELGFLTECPTNLGTGLRASIMLHLPVLELKGEIANLSEVINKIGFTVRGMYGEGTKATASLYQISNQITLGISEKNAIENLKVIASQLIDKELKSQAELEKIKLQDLVFRALGTLKYSRVISSDETMKLLSRIKLGQSVGIINNKINSLELLIESQPFMIMKNHGEMGVYERDIQRAEFLRKKLENYY